MSELTPAHPFQPGDRVRYHGPRTYGFTVLYGKVHYVERAWSEYCPILQRTFHKVKLLGLERAYHIGQFRLALRAGTVTA